MRAAHFSADRRRPFGAVAVAMEALEDEAIGPGTETAAWAAAGAVVTVVMEDEASKAEVSTGQFHISL